MKLISQIKQDLGWLCGLVYFLAFFGHVSFSSSSALPELFGPLGVQPQAVRQGSLGSCYFHSAIAAIAATNPDSLQKSIETLKQTEWRVTFADGKIENVYVDDVRYARDSG